jgi:hypothetical protein
MANMVEIDESELHTLKDKANLWDITMTSPTYVSYYTGHNGAGGVLKERYFSTRHHHDSILEREAEKKGKKLGACSYVQFKQIGMPVDIYYGRDEESRFEFLENFDE